MLHIVSWDLLLFLTFHLQLNGAAAVGTPSDSILTKIMIIASWTSHSTQYSHLAVEMVSEKGMSYVTVALRRSVPTIAAIQLPASRFLVPNATLDSVAAHSVNFSHMAQFVGSHKGSVI